MPTGTIICTTCGVTLWDVDTLPCSTPDCPIPARLEAIEDWNGERREAFKRIDETVRIKRKRDKARLLWLRDNPSPRTPAEREANLRRVLFVQ